MRLYTRLATFSAATTRRAAHSLLRTGIVPFSTVLLLGFSHIVGLPAAMAITRSHTPSRGIPPPQRSISVLSTEPLYSLPKRFGNDEEQQRRPAVTPSPKKRTSKQSKVNTLPPPKKNRTKSPKGIKSKKTAEAPSSERGITSDIVAAINPGQPFVDLNIPPSELRPSATLTTGQCFHWKAVTVGDDNEARKDSAAKKESAWGIHDATEWVGTLRTNDGESIVLVIRETPTTTVYRPLTQVPKGLDLSQFLHSYFQSDSSLSDLYKIWSKADDRLAIIAKCIPGVRIVNQDPWECLSSFICSSNNNIPRITKMLSAIRRHYGKPLVTIGSETFYSFPSLDEFSAKATDDDLRNVCGLGYRSKYILETMNLLKSLGGESYLQNLRLEDDPNTVQEQLIQFCGVGRKVADCVALFSLKQESAIPVDVHVWNIARRDYDQDGALLENVKSLTPKIYNAVGELFRSRFPEKAGWAHSLLFVAELPSFRPVLPSELVEEMDRFREQEKEKKKQGKK